MKTMNTLDPVSFFYTTREEICIHAWIKNREQLLAHRLRTIGSLEVGIAGSAVSGGIVLKIEKKSEHFNSRRMC